MKLMLTKDDGFSKTLTVDKVRLEKSGEVITIIGDKEHNQGKFANFASVTIGVSRNANPSKK